jgi:hypothetical protein
VEHIQNRKARRLGAPNPSLLEITAVGWLLVECSADVTMCSEG